MSSETPETEHEQVVGFLCDPSIRLRESRGTIALFAADAARKMRNSWNTLSEIEESWQGAPDKMTKLILAEVVKMVFGPDFIVVQKPRIYRCSSQVMKKKGNK